MLLDLLEKLPKILENCNITLNESQVETLAEALINFNGGILPSRVLKRELKISYEETHKLMIFLMTRGILKSKYKIYCENDMLTGVSKIYDDPAEIPVSICDRCNRGCSLIKNLVVEFEVCL